MNWLHLSFESWPLKLLGRSFCGVIWLRQNFDGENWSMNFLGRSFRGMNWLHLSFESWPLNFLGRNFCGVSWLHQNFDGACNSATSAGDACEPTGEMSKSFGPERDTQDTAFLRRFATQLTAASDVLVQQTGLPRIEGSGVWPIFLFYRMMSFHMLEENFTGVSNINMMSVVSAELEQK